MASLSDAETDLLCEELRQWTVADTLRAGAEPYRRGGCLDIAEFISRSYPEEPLKQCRLEYDACLAENAPPDAGTAFMLCQFRKERLGCTNITPTVGEFARCMDAYKARFTEFTLSLANKTCSDVLGAALPRDNVPEVCQRIRDNSRSLL